MNSTDNTSENNTENTSENSTELTSENSSENSSESTPSDQNRPFGFWITAVDRLLAAEFATAFEDEGITRRDWRILNAVGGTVPTGRELPGQKLRRLAELGWIERTADGWALTPDGSAAKARLSSAVAEIRAQVADALDPEEFAAMATALEKLARGLGYEEGTRLPRRRAGGRRDDDHGHRGHRGHDSGHGRRGYGRRDDSRRHGFGAPEHHQHLDHCEHARLGHDARFVRDEHSGHGQHPGFGHGDRFDHDEHPGFGHDDRFDHDEHPRFGRGGRFGGPAEHDRFADRAGFGREWLRREHLRDERRRGGGHGLHPHGEHLQGLHGAGPCGMGPHGTGSRGGHRRHAQEHIHIHLHDGHLHDGGRNGHRNG